MLLFALHIKARSRLMHRPAGSITKLMAKIAGFGILAMMKFAFLFRQVRAQSGTVPQPTGSTMTFRQDIELSGLNIMKLGIFYEALQRSETGKLYHCLCVHLPWPSNLNV